MSLDPKQVSSYLFGPVPSRRLGMSLGVDLVPFKMCTLDCVYCESGRTTDLTLQRAPLVSAESVISELGEYLADAPKLDYITFSGSGEPLLNTEIATIARYIKKNHSNYPLALLTNGTLFFKEDARKDVLDIDVIIASLDAVSTPVFEKVNRPAGGLDPRAIIQGLIDLRREFSHNLWLEIFIVPGVNDTHEELEQLAQAARMIGADKIQLNTLDRPGTESWVRAIRPEERRRIAGFFSDMEIIGAPTHQINKNEHRDMADVEKQILGIIQRRPCTEKDLQISLGLNADRLNTCIDRLCASGIVKIEKQKRGTFYRKA